MDRLHLDWETKSKADLLKCGSDVYARDPSTFVLLGAFHFNEEPIQQWSPAEGEQMPSDLREGLRDPSVKKVAFNAAFERWIAQHVLGIKTEPKDWLCSMALAYMFSFMGGLDDVGAQMALTHQKDPRGKALIRRFTMPQKPTKNQPHIWCDHTTHPQEWREFKGYNIRDVETETEEFHKLIKFFIPDWQWDLYAIDQIINDRGLPINVKFVENAMAIANRRKKDLIAEQNRITGLHNSNSAAQLLPWLQDRGYHYRDLQKDSVAKVLAQEEEQVSEMISEHGEYMVAVRPEWEEIDVIEKGKPTKQRIVARNVDVFLDESPKVNPLGQVVGDAMITQECRTVLRMRQASAKTSTTKYEAALRGLSKDGRLRQCFQFAGGSRTNRWAGRKIQPQNLPRTPKWLEPIDGVDDFDPLSLCNSLIENGDYEGLGLFAGEQMEAVAGCVRSAIQAPEGKKLVVCDLSSIESVVIGWLTDCQRLLDVFWSGKDAYKDFATEMYGIPYEQVTKLQRTNAKPATLGAGYRLSGGEMRDGKKTGLWGYAENMGINLTREESHRAVDIFRKTYSEIPSAWYSIEDMIERAMVASGRPVKWGYLEFQIQKPFLRVMLPSGRPMWYYKLRVEKETAISRAGNEYLKTFISYMGKDQVTQQWTRIESHGGKFIENFVQAIARDILALGMMECHADGFNLIGHVHDELIAEEDEDDTEKTWQRMSHLMTKALQEKHPWLVNMPLGAAGYEAKVYRKD